MIGWAAALLLAVAFSSLGFWQFARGEWKERWLADWEAALSATPVALPAIDGGTRVARPLRVDARLRPAEGAGWLLLDNQRRGSAVGVRAYRLLETGSAALLLADFGWLPFDRAAGLPSPSLPDHPIAIPGLLLPWPGQGIALGDAELPRPLPAALLLARLDRTEIAKAVQRPLVDGILKIDPSAGYGFARDLDALPNTLPVEKHYGYAVQWWGLAVTVLVVAAVLQRRSARS